MLHICWIAVSSSHPTPLPLTQKKKKITTQQKWVCLDCSWLLDMCRHVYTSEVYSNNCVSLGHLYSGDPSA